MQSMQSQREIAEKPGIDSSMNAQSGILEKFDVLTSNNRRLACVILVAEREKEF